MSNPHRDGGDEGRIEEATEALLARIRESYAPAPLGAARRVALEHALARRRERRRPRLRLAVPILAAAATAAAAALWLRMPATGPAAAPVPQVAAVQPLATADAQAAGSWTAQLFDPPELGEASNSQDTSLYPADLAAIDVAFLQP